MDHMLLDGLQSPFDGQLMGVFAENTASKYGFTRGAQDDFAIESVRRANHAVQSGAFKAEIAAVNIKDRKGERSIDTDETPAACNVGKIPQLKPAFRSGGTVTAASSSSISDGASALVLLSADAVARHSVKPLAQVMAYASYAHEPEWFTTAPIGAIGKVLGQLRWSASDVDLFEVNEAFACVTMAAMREFGIDPAKINVNGGACALGHPIGASGARIVTTLVHALKARGLKRGVAALCIGGGEATAIAVEIC